MADTHQLTASRAALASGRSVVTAPGQAYTSLLSQAIMIVNTGMLAIFWLLWDYNRDIAAVILRPIMLGGAILLVLLWSKKPATRAERQLAAILGTIIVALLVPSLLATDPARGLAEWVKLILICIYCFCFARGLRDRATARMYAIGLMFGACVTAVFLFVTFIHFMGFTLPSYEAARHYKGLATRAGVLVNTAAFSCIFSYVCAMCILRRTRLLWLLGFVLLAICTLFTGTRMPPGVTAGSAILLAAIAGIRSRRLLPRVFTWMILGCAAAALLIVAVRVNSETIFRTMSKASEGRWDVWSVAWAKFTERPIFGYGYVSWRDDLVSRLPGEYKMTREIAEMIAGGYHNEFMTVLAEQGIFGTAAVLALYWYVLRSGWRLAFAKWITWKNGQWALFAGIFLLLRANVEVPGLFGYAQEPADFIAYAFLAILVSSFSAEEDYRRRVEAASVHMNWRFERIHAASLFARRPTVSEPGLSD